MRVFVDGQELELYTIGQTAKLLKKSVETLRAWERQKIMPKPMYMAKKVRLYHPKEVEAMRKALKKVGNYARKDVLQKALWGALKEARLEILGEPNDEDRSEQN